MNLSFQLDPIPSFFLPNVEMEATEHVVCTEVEYLGEVTHQDIQRGARRSTQRIKQRAEELRNIYSSKQV